MKKKILVVDDETYFLTTIQRGLKIAGYDDVVLESNPKNAARRFEKGHTYDVALIDVNMPEMDGVELMEMIKNRSPHTECIMVTAIDDTKTAVGCIKNGAYDYLLKPLSPEDLILTIDRALERKRFIELLDIKNTPDLSGHKLSSAFHPIVTRCDKMIRVLKEAELHAESNVPCLITGESGTGKELLAKAIHNASPRAHKPFTPINMAAPSGNLFDAEFFGHARGAFTGADSERKGYLETTAGGTLFMDEIGHMPLSLQGKLLRVLQEGEFMKLGTSRIMKTDIRFIAATNADLDRLISENEFRKDLYYRLKGAWIHLPPLKERKKDIPLLIDHFIKEFKHQNTDIVIAPDAMDILVNYPYPGNVRELKSIIQAAINLATAGLIASGLLPDYIIKANNSKPASDTRNQADLQLSQVEKNHILKVYDMAGNNKAKASKMLGIGLNTLRRRLKSYGVK